MTTRLQSTTRRVADESTRMLTYPASTPISPSPTRTAVIYARVSSREQEREGFSIPAQLDLLRSYAAEHNFDVVEEFTDVETAKRTGRTHFGRMLTYLRKRRTNQPVILVEKTDRLYRNLKDWVSVDALKVDVHLVKEGVVLSDDSRSSEKFVHGIKVLMAKNYVDNLSEEVRKGMNHKASDGHWPSAAPIGYLNRREAGQSRIVPDPERALMIRNLFELYDTGDWSLAGLARYCAEQGMRGKRGGKITASQVHAILRNPLYAGRFYWGGELYDGKDPKLIPWALYERVQDRMDGHVYTRPAKRVFAYGGMMTCGHCGAAITAEIKKKKYVYYRCSQRCEVHAYVREEVVTKQFLQHVAKLRLPPDVSRMLIDGLKEQHDEIETEVRTRIADAQDRVEKFGRLIDAAYEDKLEGRITDAFFHERRQGWERQRRDAAREIERLTQVSAKSLSFGVQLVELANRAYDLLSRQEPAEHQDLLTTLLSNSFLTGDTLTVEWRNPFDLLANRPDGDPNEKAPGLGDPGQLLKWSGWVDAYRTFWVDPGPGWTTDLAPRLASLPR